MSKKIKERLEYLRGELRAERISYDDLHELQSLTEHIEPGDVELLEPAGVPEFPIPKDDWRRQLHNGDEIKVPAPNDNEVAVIQTIEYLPNDTVRILTKKGEKIKCLLHEIS